MYGNSFRKQSLLPTNPDAESHFVNPPNPADNTTGNSTACPTEGHLELNRLICGYGEEPVVRNLSLSLATGQIGGLLGPSGCGKTTVLRAIAGFVKLQAGEIRVHQKLLSSSNLNVPPEQRHLGMVYQDYALFPHLSVEQNICFGLYRKSREYRQSRCTELLGLVQLEGFEQRFPSELSGGQQQRVALARSLATKPDILLLDEPFSGLDAELRRELSRSIRDILKQQNTTALLVTHDQEEAFAVADQVGVMQCGQLLQWDSAYNIYHQPNQRFVANFVGRGCLIKGRVRDQSSVETELGTVFGESSRAMQIGTEVELLVRPDDLVTDTESPIRGRIGCKLFVGSNTLYRVRLASGVEVETLLSSHENYETDSEIGLRYQAPHLITFESTARRVVD